MEINWNIVSNSEVEISKLQFWKAVSILQERPNIVNRRLSGSKTIFTVRLLEPVEPNWFVQCASTNSYNAFSYENLSNIFIRNGIKHELHEKSVNLVKNSELLVIVTNLISKNEDVYKSCLQLSYIDADSSSIMVCSLWDKDKLQKCVSPSSAYMLQYKNNSVQLLLDANTLVDDNTSTWLTSQLFPKICKWASYDEEKKQPFSVSSLSLVPVDRYTEYYKFLKDKYALSLVQMWQENTDPLKFVYEDIAIASYLCLLWGDKKQTFVDMGCGNGLLLHILNCEGHRGIGLDVRPRKIWSTYPTDTDIRVATVSSSENWEFPEANWIIGNHSDELTPWIPVFASRTSYQCNFFLLPCCAYTFTGSRYQRQDSSVSLYEDYLKYIIRICCTIGFNIKIDKLRIPSTKRICIISDSRKYAENNYNTSKNNLEKFVKIQLTNVMKFRESIEQVRNCTQIDKSVSSDIVKIITEKLIRSVESVPEYSNCCEYIWQHSLSLNELSTLISERHKVYLKNQCGGLQTLLKNHHDIFNVINGRVSFRKPTSKNQSNFTSSNWKKRQCWFFHNHPFSCPLSDTNCSFIH